MSAGYRNSPVEISCHSLSIENRLWVSALSSITDPNTSITTNEYLPLLIFKGQQQVIVCCSVVVIQQPGNCIKVNRVIQRRNIDWGYTCSLTNRRGEHVYNLIVSFGIVSVNNGLSGSIHEWVALAFHSIIRRPAYITPSDCTVE